MITADARQMERAARALQHLPGAVERATARALNRAAIAGRARGIEAMRERYAVSANDARDKITLTMATTERLEVEVRAKSPALSLGYFPHAPTRAGTGGRGRPQLTAEILRGQRREVRDERGPVFVAMINGRPRVMRRLPGKTTTGKARMESVYSVPIALMLGAASVREAVERRALQMFDARIDHEIARELEAGR